MCFDDLAVCFSVPFQKLTVLILISSTLTGGKKMSDNAKLWVGAIAWVIIYLILSLNTGWEPLLCMFLAAVIVIGFLILILLVHIEGEKKETLNKINDTHLRHFALKGAELKAEKERVIQEIREDIREDEIAADECQNKIDAEMITKNGIHGGGILLAAAASDACDQRANAERSKLSAIQLELNWKKKILADYGIK